MTPRSWTVSYASARTQRAAEVDRRLASLIGDEHDVALVAIGGHGRRELTPGSDLDLVLLHRGRPDVAALADKIWYPIWDAGIRLDHAVRTVAEAREVARDDLKAALGMLCARHVAGDPVLTACLREAVLGDWRADARRRLPELRALAAERAQRFGELAFLTEPDLKEARGGLRDVHAMQAVAAAWVAPAPGPRVRAAYEQILDARHALHDVTGRAGDRLVQEVQDDVARALGLLDADLLLRDLAEAGRTVAFAADHVWWQVDRFLAPSRRSMRPRRAERRPLADGVVEQDGAVVLARDADPDADPVLPLRAAAAAAASGLPLAPATLDRLARAAPMPVPWPDAGRDALLALLGAGPAAIPVWEALDQVGLIVRLLPDWERVRNRPQRDPWHTFTVDRHLVETVARAAAHTRDVARPDLLLLAALCHDIGKGWPGDHCVTGAVVARDLGVRMGLGADSVETLAAVVRHHLLLPRTATRRDLDDPATVRNVAALVGRQEVLELLAALAVADGQATGPAAWDPWKQALVAELVHRVGGMLAGEPSPPLPELTREQRELAATGGPAVRIRRAEVTIVAPDRPGLLWQAAGVLALHRLTVRAATARSHGPTAVTVFTAVPQYGDPPDPVLLEDDLLRALDGRLDVGERLARRERAYRVGAGAGGRRHGRDAPVAPPRVTFVDDASHRATVVEVRAHDEPGLLWRIGRTLGACGLDIRAARVETLGAEAVDTFYVVDRAGRPLTDRAARTHVRAAVLEALLRSAPSGR